MHKTAILVVSFGSSYPDTRARTIHQIEEDIRQAHPDCDVYTAWTSSILRKKVKQQENLVIPGVSEALDDLHSKGYRRVFLQPTHIINGHEYDKIAAIANDYGSHFDSITMGLPLLASEDDIYAILQILNQEIPLPENQMLVLMGHGSDHIMNRLYQDINRLLPSINPNIYLGTVEGHPDLEEVMAEIERHAPAKIHLTPFLIVAGDHALNDMAGEGPASWKSILSQAGYSVNCILKGLGEYPAIRQIILQHLDNVMAKN